LEFLTPTGSVRLVLVELLRLVTLTAFDLGILHKEDKEMGIGESLKLTAFYITIALAFGVWVWMRKGRRSGDEVLHRLLHRKGAVDRQRLRDQPDLHLFCDSPKYQYRALLWGIIAVIVLRGAIMIAAGRGAGRAGLLGALYLRGLPDLHRHQDVLRGDHNPISAKTRWCAGFRPTCA
jgi:hypothetical protein